MKTPSVCFFLNKGFNKDWLKRSFFNELSDSKMMASFIYKFSLTCGLYHHCRVSGRVCHGYDGSGGWLVWGSLRPGLCTFSQCSNGKFSIYMHMLCVRTCVSVITTSLSVPVSTHHCRIVKVAYSGPSTGAALSTDAMHSSPSVFSHSFKDQKSIWACAHVYVTECE